MNSKRLSAAALLICFFGMHSALPGQVPDPANDSPERSGTPQRSGASSLPGGYQFPTAGERFHAYGNDIIGPFALLFVTGRAGIAQWWDDPTEWSGDIGGYGRRVASTFGTNLVKKTLEYGLNEALHRDSRYYRCSCQGFMPRLAHVVKSTLAARNREGRYVFSAPVLAANYSAEIIATAAWYPDRYNYKDGLRNGNWALLGRLGINAAFEFILKK
jgi:hypothetical protein